MNHIFYSYFKIGINSNKNYEQNSWTTSQKHKETMVGLLKVVEMIKKYIIFLERLKFGEKKATG